MTLRGCWMRLLDWIHKLPLSRLLSWMKSHNPWLWGSSNLNKTILVLPRSALSQTSNFRHHSICHQSQPAELSAARFQFKAHSRAATFLSQIWKKVQPPVAKTPDYSVLQSSKTKCLRTFQHALVWGSTVWGCSSKTVPSRLSLDRGLKPLKSR